MLMQIDGTFLFAAISFLIFLIIIKFILFNPITKVLDERNKFFEKNSKMEKETKEKSRILIEETEAAIRQTRNKAGEIIKTTVDGAKKESEAILKEAKQEAHSNLEKHNVKLEEESNFAKKELKQEFSNFVSLIVSKVLNEDIKVDLDEEKIEQHLKI